MKIWDIMGWDITNGYRNAICHDQPYMILMMGVVPEHEDSLYIDCHSSVLI